MTEDSQSEHGFPSPEELPQPVVKRRRFSASLI